MADHKSNLIIKKYLESVGLVKNDLDSFNSFIEWRLQRLIDDIGTVSPAVIPADAESVEFKLGKASIGKPILIEADGAERKILPSEARLRDLTYSAPIFVEITLLINGKEREHAEVQIVEIPIMLRSKFCYLSGMSDEELIESGEDLYDLGGYFIINGTERALILLEDLAPNVIFADAVGGRAVTHTCRIYSSSGKYRIPHSIDRKKDGTLVIDFSSIKELHLFTLIKALGMLVDKDITDNIHLEEDDDLYVNLYDCVDIKKESDAQELLAKELKLPQDKDQRDRRINYILDKTLLPHVGEHPEDRIKKARFLCRMIRKILLLKQNKIKPDEKDHYMNKRVRLAGDLLEDLMRVNLKSFINDMLYVFQRGVRRGIILPIHSMIQTKFLTQRINSAMATGAWVGGKQGMSQRLERDNALATISHLTRVGSLLKTTQENFEARELHPTHFGRLCAIDTPDGKNIGLRKSLALLADITPELKEEVLKSNLKVLETMGTKLFEK